MFVSSFLSSTRPTPWMRGITPSRLGILALVFILMHVNNPSFLNDDFFLRFGRILHNAAVFFAAAFPMFVLIVKTEIWTAESPTRVRIAALVLAVVVGAASFAIFRWGLRIGALPLIGRPGGYWEYSLGHFFRALVVGGLFTSILFYEAREREAQRRLNLSRLSRVAIDKQMAEARLQLLQAQIEPHFLFNSLASVKRLYEKEPDRGRSLLRNLGDYLRIAISRARLREAQLGEEIALARSFLEIFKVRMGRRLRVRIEMPAELDAAMVPPLMVGTLVENAIKHGIGPRASGGTVSITARREGEFIGVAVSDDGVGFRARFGHGVGLANIRARLETLFAADGTLELAANPGGGVSATIRLPYRTAAPAPASP
jgi:signal transduction histidine kinase